MPEQPPVNLRSYEFRREREATWRRLEDLVKRVEAKGLGVLSPAELHRLPALYRSVLSSLSVARAISLDLNVVAYLESLAARSYLIVYSTRRRFGDAVVRFFARRFPQLVWSMRRALILSISLLSLGVLAGYTLTMDDPDRFYSFVGEDMAGGRTPASSHDMLRATLYDDSSSLGDSLTVFATFLFTHNAKIGLLCFALGFAAGVPVMLLLFINGLTLGAMAAVFARQGLSADFWLWVLPHGVTELLAVAICGAAGLALGYSVVFPGRYSRLQNLARRGREAAAVVVGAVVLFMVAALIEGFFRQLVHEIEWRAFVVGLTALIWVVYFGRGARLPRLEAETAP